MFIGLLMVLAPIAVFILTIKRSKDLNPILRKAYLVLGGIVVFFGGSVSVYFAAYTGDQGGIAAFYFQILVILVYAALSLSVVTMHWATRVGSTEENIGNTINSGDPEE